MNGKIDNLQEAVLTDARALAYEVMQEAIRNGEQVATEGASRIADERAAEMANAEVEAERGRQRILAEAQAEIRSESLAAREKMIARVLREVRKSCADAASDPSKGRALLLQLAAEGAGAISNGRIKLIVRPDDRNRVDASFLEEVKKETGKRAELSEEAHDGLGGVIVTSADGRERYDNTLDNRLDRRMPDVRAMIWTRLSHAG